MLALCSSLLLSSSGLPQPILEASVEAEGATLQCGPQQLQHCADRCVVDGVLHVADDVSYIGDQISFANCANIKSVFLNKVQGIGLGAFEGCDNLKDVHMPEVKTVGPWAFAHCPKLASVTAPKVQLVDGEAFYSDVALATFDAPALMKVGDDAFHGTTCGDDGTACSP